MSKEIVVTGGTVVDPAQGINGAMDILVQDGQVRALEKPGAFGARNEGSVIDASGKLVVPGLIDLHVHLREPGFEWKETILSGARAAAWGGFTTICCMPNTRPVNDCAEVTKFILDKARSAGFARVLPIGSVSRSLEGKEMSPYSELRTAGCAAFSDDGEPVYNAGLMRRALEWCRMLDVPIMCHEEDKSLSCGGAMNESPLSTRMGLKGWPKVAEEVMIARDIELARVTKSKLHFCHVTTARGVELIRRAKNDGIQVTAEVTPHHLTLTEERAGDYDTNAKMSPPLRQEEDLHALVQGLKDGTIDAIASDHAPHELDSKQVEFEMAAFGIIGLQTNLPLTLGLVRDGKVDISRAIESWTSAPASVLGLRDCGNLRPGARADICIIDPQAEWNLSASEIISLSRNSPFIGSSMKGRAESVLVSGKALFSNYAWGEPDGG